jgi:hypothetical protein
MPPRLVKRRILNAQKGDLINHPFYEKFLSIIGDITIGE